MLPVIGSTVFSLRSAARSFSGSLGTPAGSVAQYGNALTMRKLGKFWTGLAQYSKPRVEQWKADRVDERKLSAEHKCSTALLSLINSLFAKRVEAGEHQ